MPTQPLRFSRLRRLQMTVCVLAILGGIILVFFGLTKEEVGVDLWLIVAGDFVLFLAIMLLTFVPLVIKIEASLARQLGELRDLNERLATHAVTLDAIAENTRISDAAKSLTHREQELDALRSAIQEDVRTEKWALAFKLLEVMEKRFGYVEEAQALRAETERARQAAIKQKLSEAFALMEHHFASFEWERAGGEIDRLVQLFPKHEQVRALPARMSALRDKRKKELQRAFNDAANRNDTDQAIDILKELDAYLTPEEGKALEDDARLVFKEKLLQLGVRFRFAVNEKRWHDALDTGVELVREFPNARMAREVQDSLNLLRERAQQAADADTNPT